MYKQNKSYSLSKLDESIYLFTILYPLSHYYVDINGENTFIKILVCMYGERKKKSNSYWYFNSTIGVSLYQLLSV